MTQCEKCIHQKVCRARDRHDEVDICVVTYCSNFMPTADVVEVVRCKDCNASLDQGMENIIRCRWTGKHHILDYFCYDGERKE